MRRLALLASLLLMILVHSGYALDPFYHTNAEILERITTLQQQYPDLVRIDTIGYSQQDNLPIWAVKLSNNVSDDEDEPTVLLVGQVHAEEILGVEIVMALLDTILAKQTVNPYHFWLQKLELWLIPTANPEGHAVVLADTLDDTYRKNKRDVNGNGIFDFNAGVGQDSDGVDINRNFPLNWVHGDTYLQPGGYEPYDYYRGAYPLSESEARALWDLGARERFSFSVVWHSSRTGNNSEKIFYPWDWDDALKYPGGFNVINNTAILIAESIPNSSGGTYLPFPTDSPRGNQHDNFYAAYNTIAFLIECGTGNIQPPASGALTVIANNFQGVTLMLNRAADYNSANRAQITGVVRDANTNPLPAKIAIPQLDGPYQEQTTCDSAFGRYRRYVEPGQYTLHAHLRGYYAQDTTLVANASGKVTKDFFLQSKPIYTFSGTLQDVHTGSLISGTIFIHGEDVQDTLIVNGSGAFSYPLPEGYYSLTIDCPGYVVRFNPLWHHQNSTIAYELSPQIILFSDDFESGLGQWIHGGGNDHWGTETADALWNPASIVATESPGAEYNAYTNSWLKLSSPLNLTDFTTASLRFQHWYYFEPDYDKGWVDVSTDGGATWVKLCGQFDRQDVGPGWIYGDLDSYCGLNNVLLRWRVGSDGNLHNQGWRIDNVMVSAADTAVLSINPSLEPPSDYTLLSVFPNPFNSQLSLVLNLSGSHVMEISLWDVAGRQVAGIQAGRLEQGSHHLTWEAPAGLATGLYLLKVQQESGTDVRKILYLK